MKTTDTPSTLRSVRRPLQSGMHLESLEPRCLLATLAMTDAFVVNGINRDNDLSLRSFDLQYIVEATGAGSSQYRVDIYAQPVGSLSRQLILQSSIETIDPGQSRTSSYPINPELTGVPIGGSGRVHFSLTLVPLDAPPATFEDVDINDISMELASLDQEAPDVLPIVSNLGASPNGTPNPLIEDMAVNLSVTAQSEAGIRSVTIFFDRNGNGLLEPSDRFGPDAYSTVKTATFGAGTINDGIWFAEFLVDPDWTSGTISWAAIAVDFAGNVSIPTFTTARVAQPPRVNGVTPFVMRGTSGFVELHDAAVWYQPGSSFVYGETVQLRPNFETFAPLAHVYYIFDRDDSGGWSNGDTILGEGEAIYDYQLTFVLDQNWGVRDPAHVIVDAVDINGLWARQRSTAAFVVTDRPVVSNIQIPPSAGAGQIMRVSANVTDSSPRVVTWFIDRLANFRFDPGIDVDLGADFNGSDGWSLDVLVTPQMAGRSVIMADARDAQGAWAGPTAGTSMYISAGPIVAFITTSPATTLFAKGETVTLTAAVSAGIQLTGVTFFLDANGDGGWTPGTDVDLGTDTNAAGGWTKTFTVGSTWPAAGARFGANGFNGATFGDFSKTTGLVDFSVGPLVGSITTPSSVTWNESFTVTASNLRGSNVRAVSFFFDADHNGFWTPGFDTDLGADFDGTNGWSITTTARTTWFPESNGRIVASAVNTNGSWGRGTSTNAFNVFDRPRVSDPGFESNGTIGPSTVTFGSTGSLNVDFIASTGVVTATFFVDIDQNGRWTPGTDIDLGSTATFFQTSGSAVKPITFNFGHGTFSILADARDSRGRWSGSPVSQTITIV